MIGHRVDGRNPTWPNIYDTTMSPRASLHQVRQGFNSIAILFCKLRQVQLALVPILWFTLSSRVELGSFHSPLIRPPALKLRTMPRELRS